MHCWDEQKGKKRCLMNSNQFLSFPLDGKWKWNSEDFWKV